MSDLREQRPPRCYLCGARLVWGTRRAHDHSRTALRAKPATQVLAYDAVGVFASTPSAQPHVHTCPRRGLLLAVTE